jgi:hypothetical protein
MAFVGSQARLIYFSEVQIAIEATDGLTNPDISHQTITTRGRPGHEKEAPTDYVYMKNANFIAGDFQKALGVVYFDDVSVRTIVYEEPLMEQLAKYPEVEFVRFPAYLDGYIKGMSSLSAAQVDHDYHFFKLYYFDHNNDETREQAFRSYLAHGK